jgi:hypothetical protein
MESTGYVGITYAKRLHPLLLKRHGMPSVAQPLLS